MFASGDIVREIPLIEKLARNNESDDNRFRAHLKGKLNLSTVATDLIVKETTEQVWQHIDCRDCANCCKKLPVVVDNADINRLSKRLNISIKEFTHRYTHVTEHGEKQFKTTPCPLLGTDNLCTVYEDRPKACTEFPYLYEKHFTSRSITMLCNTEVCPIVFNVWKELKFRLGYTKSKVTKR